MRRGIAPGSPRPPSGFRRSVELTPGETRAVSRPEASWEQPARILLALQKFDARSLETLCVDVDIDPGELEGQDVEQSRLALVKLFEDRHQLDLLEDAIGRARSVRSLRNALPSPPKGKIWVFISYSHKDEKLRNELYDLLEVLEESGLVGAWWDGQILPGDEFDAEIRQHLDEAHVILLLVTRPFLTSKYVRQVELPRAMERHEAGQARVIPIILKPAPWQDPPWHDWFGKLTVLPKDGKPVSKWKDEAFSYIYSKVLATVNEMIERQDAAGNGK